MLLCLWRASCSAPTERPVQRAISLSHRIAWCSSGCVGSGWHRIQPDPSAECPSQSFRCVVDDEEGPPRPSPHRLAAQNGQDLHVWRTDSVPPENDGLQRFHVQLLRERFPPARFVQSTVHGGHRRRRRWIQCASPMHRRPRQRFSWVDDRQLDGPFNWTDRYDNRPAAAASSRVRFRRPRRLRRQK